MAKKYTFDDHPEHKAQLEAWRDKWIANALNCNAMTDDDRSTARVAIDGLYRAANLPPPERVQFVSSPLVGAIAASVASGAWWLRENPAEAKKLFGVVIGEPELMRAVALAARECVQRCMASLRGKAIEPLPATDAATYAATGDATYAATRDATRDATGAATDAATDAATRAATRDATRDATDAATRAATDAATYAATGAATDAATRAATRDATRDATDAATRAATDAATYAATGDATDAATGAATYAATGDATYAATRAATRDATYAATGDATYAATRDATRDATYAATGAATRAADPVVNFLVRCSVHWWKFWNGGNQWSGWCSYLSFFRHIAKLPLDYSKWAHYETLAEVAGPRFMHAKFCVLSDRPEFVHRDSANRPHRIDGPHIRWRDGVELHHIHGIRVLPKITAGEFTAQDARDAANAEVRRVMVQRYNQGDTGRYLRDIGAKVIHEDTDALGLSRRLLRIEQSGDEPFVAIEVTNSTPEPDGTRKIYTFRCHPELRPLPIPGIRKEYGEPQALTCQNAIASTYGYTGDDFDMSVQT